MGNTSEEEKRHKLLLSRIKEGTIPADEIPAEAVGYPMDFAMAHRINKKGQHEYKV